MKYTRTAGKCLLVLLVFASAMSLAEAPIVKLSSSGICHDSESPYFSRTKQFTAFATLEACLEEGGRLPKGAAPADTPSPERSTGAIYKREHFGSGWLDTDGDCQDARQEALAAQSTAPVRFESERGCRVIAGRWISPFTGKAIHDPSAIDIDHVVPLKWAWDHGASDWTREKRERFANDPVNLLSVEASLNRSKGAKGLIDWLPPSGQCQYTLRFLRVLRIYKLALSPEVANKHEGLRLRVCKRT